MLISVIVPSVRPIKCLNRLLIDFSYQTLKDFEMVLIRDGKPDAETETYLNLAGKKYQWLHWSWIQRNRNPPEGPGTLARNYAMSIARGEYVCFADDDDRFKSTYLEALAEVAGPRQIGLVRIYVQESRAYKDGGKNRTVAIPEIGQKLQCGQLSSQSMIVPRKDAVMHPWQHNYNHDYLFFKAIQNAGLKVVINYNRGPQVDLDAATIGSLHHWK